MGIGCGVGYSWLFYNYSTYQSTNGYAVCIIKNVTRISCPSCGSTRAVESLIHGNLIESLFLNPLGLILISLLISVPIWISFDIISRKSSLYDFYLKSEQLLRQKKYAIPAIILMLANWVWNIYKGL